MSFQKSRTLVFAILFALLLASISFIPATSVVKKAYAASKVPLLQLPWPSNKVHGINGGDTYGCGLHQNADYYAIDFVFAIGDAVSAVASGVAHLAQQSGDGYGNFLWIRHTNPDGTINGFVSLYAHLNSYNVTEGQQVKQGDVIAYSGNSGNVPAHLHFAMYQNISSTDNTPWNDGQTVAYKPEPMSGYTGFGHYGINLPKCDVNNPNPSPEYNASPWTQFAFNGSGVSYNPFEEGLGTSNVSQLTQEWPALQGIEGDTSPIIDNGMVYTTTHWGTLYALDQATGSIVWQQSAGGITEGSATVYDGVVLVAAMDNNIHAFDATSGKSLWTKPGGSFYAKVTVVNGVAYVIIGSQTGNNQFAAYTVKTGSTKWTVPFPCWGEDAPTVANGIVYVECNNLLYAINASNGSMAWAQPQPASFVTPSIYNGIVYTTKRPTSSTDNNLVAYNAKTGALVWGKQIGTNPLVDTPAIANGVVFVATDENGGVSQYVYAFNAKTGAQIWQTHINGNIFVGGTADIAPAVANGVLYVTIHIPTSSILSILIAFNASTGASLWTLSPSNTNIISSPTVANSRLYVWEYPYEIVSFHVPGM